MNRVVKDLLAELNGAKRLLERWGGAEIEEHAALRSETAKFLSRREEKGRILDSIVDMSIADGLPTLEDAQEELRAAGLIPGEVGLSLRERLGAGIAGLTEERETEIRALLRKPIGEWPRGEPHIAVGELLDEVERVQYEWQARCGTRSLEGRS
jgi:hypothetical protein